MALMGPQWSAFPERGVDPRIRSRRWAPLAQGRERTIATARQSAAVQPGPSSARLSVLVVEHDLHDGQRFEALLSMDAAHTSHGVRRVTCLSEALASDVEDPDVVLLDLGLPDVGDLSGLLRLRSRFASAAIVVLTGGQGEATKLQALRSGAQDFLEKNGLTADTLHRAVRHSVERHRLVRDAELSQQHLTALNRRLREAHDTLEQLVLRDPLTEFLNRRGLHEVVEHRRRSGRAGRLVSILVDVDDFSAINESLGWSAGDVILRELSLRLRETVGRAGDIARVGDDQFLVLMHEGSCRDGLRLGEAIRLAIGGTPVMEVSGPLHITASVGVAAVNRQRASVGHLVQSAHVALGRGRFTGPNQVGFDRGSAAPPGGGVMHDEFSAAVAQLRDGRSLYAVVHPFVELATSQTVGYEFLARTELDTFDGPAQFFRTCREHRCLTEVDMHCFEICARESRRVEATAWRHINLFPSSMLEVDIDQLLAMLPPEAHERTCVEISEQQVIGDPSYLLDTVAALRDGGVCIAMDDVGFGRSCVETLVLLEPDVVKIDRNFVHGVSASLERRRALARLLRVIDGVGALVIAEGIETTQDRDALLDLGVRYGQGYLWGKPCRLDEREAGLVSQGP